MIIMRTFAFSAVTAGLLLGFAGMAAAQQQKAQPPAMQGIDQSNMQGMKGMEGMQGMDHSKMPMNMQGMDHSNMPGMQRGGQAGQGTRAPAPAKPARPGTSSQ